MLKTFSADESSLADSLINYIQFENGEKFLYFRVEVSSTSLSYFYECFNLFIHNFSKKSFCFEDSSFELITITTSPSNFSLCFFFFKG